MSTDADRVLDLLADLVADRVRARLAPTGARRARIATLGITTRQIPTLEREGVAFDKQGKYWTVDLDSLDAYRERQRAERVAAESVRADGPDPLASVDPAVRRAFERAARGER